MHTVEAPNCEKAKICFLLAWRKTQTWSAAKINPRPKSMYTWSSAKRPTYLQEILKWKSIFFAVFYFFSAIPIYTKYANCLRFIERDNVRCFARFNFFLGIHFLLCATLCLHSTNPYVSSSIQQSVASSTYFFALCELAILALHKVKLQSFRISFASICHALNLVYCVNIRVYIFSVYGTVLSRCVYLFNVFNM